MSNSTNPPTPGFEAPAPEVLDAQIGSAFEVLEIIGFGGMGAVYKARQPRLDRFVAIKILPPMEDVEGIDFTRRFESEAKAMAKLDHPNIITVFDFGEIEPNEPGEMPLLYFVMEYVDGTDLSEVIPSGQLSQPHIIGWIPQICDALQYAHGNGIIHRDIKPANIMLTREGRVKIADFGLAKIIGNSPEQQGGQRQSNVTLGTPDYVAPESLIMGVQIDYRADIFSMGVVLYEMLTGVVPGESKQPPSALVSGLDGRFDGVIARAMESDRDQRYQNANDLGAAVARIGSEPESRRRTLVTGPVNPADARKVGSTAPVKVSSHGGSPLQERLAQQKEKRLAEARLAEAKKKKRRGVALLVGGPLAIAGIGALILSSFLKEEEKKPGGGSRKANAPAVASAKPKESVTQKPKPAAKPAPAVKDEPPPPALAGAEEGGESSADPVTSQPESTGELASSGQPESIPATNPESPPESEVSGDGSRDIAPAEDPGINAEVAAALVEWEKQFGSQIEGGARTAYDTALAKLNQNYLTALERDAKAVQANPGVLGIYRNEIARIRAGEGVPSKDVEQIPVRLRTLRKTWRNEEGRLAQARNKQERPLVKSYLDEIEALENQLVADGHAISTAPIKPIRLALLSRLESMKSESGDGNESPEENKNRVAPTSPVLTLVPELPFPPKVNEIPGEVIAWNAKGTTGPRIVARDVVDFSFHDMGGFILLDPDGKLRKAGKEDYLSMKSLRPMGSVIDVSICRELGLALRSDGVLETWGKQDGGVGEVPRSVRDIVKFEARPTYGVALKSNGRLEVWGDYAEGLRGFLEKESNVADFAIGRNYAIILKRNGRVLVRDEGGATVPPEELEEANAIREAVAIDCVMWPPDSNASIALLKSGRVVTWGWPRGTDGSRFRTPSTLPKDIDQVRMGQKGKAAIHSVSQGWIFLGTNLNHKQCQANAAGCLDIQFRHIDEVVGFRAAATATKVPSLEETAQEHFSGLTIRVSPQGWGDTVTLDEALASAKEGDRIWLAPGVYPPSEIGMRSDGKPAYLVEAPYLTIQGHRSRITGNLVLRAKNGPIVRGIWADNIGVGTKKRDDDTAVPGRGVLIEHSRANYFNSVIGSRYRLRNFVGEVQTTERGKVEIENSTIVSRSARYTLHKVETSISDSIYRTNADVVFRSYNSPNVPRALERVMLFSGSDVLDVEGGIRVKTIDELEGINIKTTDCLFGDPQFVDPESGDWRLRDDSPAKGLGPGGRDLGAVLDAEGWPIADEN